MKTTFKTLFAAAAIAAFTATGCSQKTQDNAEATAESAGQDAANATESAGDAVENATDNVGAAASNAANEVKEDMKREPGDTAVVRDRPADGVVDQTTPKQ